MLPNGNTLVVETDGGRALELTGDGEIVWEFRSPYRVSEQGSGGVSEQGNRVAHLYSLRRVDAKLTGWLDATH